ncbi:MAG: hypothetical protein HC898_07125 [Phycisphaerales bacterium]|nr:hypothetical protein [Phycisphaerales bacterium]
MRTFRWYGPALVLLLTALVVMVAGPGLARKLAYESHAQTIQLIKDDLRQNISLAQLSQSFKDVAKVVEPSVVYIQVYKKSTGNSMAPRSMEQDLFRRFFGPRGIPPEMMPPGWGEDEPMDPDAQPEPRDRNRQDMDRYNVPRRWVPAQGGFTVPMATSSPTTM